LFGGPAGAFVGLPKVELAGRFAGPGSAFDVLPNVGLAGRFAGPGSEVLPIPGLAGRVGGLFAGTLLNCGPELVGSVLSSPEEKPLPTAGGPDDPGNDLSRRELFKSVAPSG
jgi:hypothetical protein